MRSAACPGFILVLTLSILAACGGGKVDQHGEETDAMVEPAPGPPETVEAASSLPGELDGVWTLVAIDGNPVTKAAKIPTLQLFPDGTVQGVGGVNRFHTQFEIVDGRLSFGPAAATKMAGPPDAMKVEAEYLARLGAVSSFDVDDTTLRLWAGDNQALTFERGEN